MKRFSFLMAAVAIAAAPAMAVTSSLSDPLEMPYYESFAGAQLTSADWEVIPISGETATMRARTWNEELGLTPFLKRDKGMFEVLNDKVGSFYLLTPYIRVADNAAGAVFGLSYFVGNGMTINGVHQIDGGDITTDNNLSPWPCDPMNSSWVTMSGTGWPKYGTYAGQVMRFGWEITTDGTGGSFCLDEVFFKVPDIYDFGLLHEHVTPAARPGQKITASVDVGVFGQLTSMNFNVIAKFDGTQFGQPVRPQSNPWGTKYTNCVFEYTLPEDIAPGEHNVTFELTFEGDYAADSDSNLDNNVASATINVTGGYLPGVTGLAVAGTKLSWTAPATGVRFIDDVEQHRSFDDGNLDAVYQLHPVFDYDTFLYSFGNTGNIDQYSVIDADGKVTLADENWADLCVDNVFHLMACTVADFSVETEGLDAASGNKAFLFWSNQDGTPCDNYLILPEINPDDRNISFKARAFSSDCPETIEIMTSSTGIAAADFSVKETLTVSSPDFVPVECTIPAGTKYVAIRHTSDEGYALVVDDLEYAMKPRTVTGYNVYLDGVKVNDAPLGTTSFEVPANGNYSVSAVYPEGESAVCTPVSVSSVGISSVEATDAPALYFNLQGFPVENPQKGIFIKVTPRGSEKVVL